MMRSLKILFSILLVTLMAQANVFGQNADKKIDAAIKVGNAHALSEYFGPKVDLTILDTENNYSKAQAEQILKDFFAKNKVSDYKVIHHGSAKDGAQYFIGSLSSNTGNFRTYLLLRADNKKTRIQQLRIEAAN